MRTKISFFTLDKKIYKLSEKAKDLTVNFSNASQREGNLEFRNIIGEKPNCDIVSGYGFQDFSKSKRIVTSHEPCAEKLTTRIIQGWRSRQPWWKVIGNECRAVLHSTSNMALPVNMKLCICPMSGIEMHLTPHATVSSDFWGNETVHVFLLSSRCPATTARTIGPS